MINLERLVGEESAWRMRTAGLHKMAAAIARSEGFPLTSDVMDLPTAIGVIGSKRYIKSAEFKNIIRGAAALRDIAQ